MTATPDPQAVREIGYCPHADYPIQVTLTLLDGDVDVKHADCGRIVQTDWPYLRADHVPPELAYATDGDEDWLELRAMSTKQPQNAPSVDNAMSDGCAQLARIPLPDRIDLIAQHLVPATEELRGLTGASHARLLIVAAVASLRWVVDDLRSGKERAEQPQDERDAALAELSAELTAANVDNAVIARQRAELRARVRELEAAQDERDEDHRGDGATDCPACSAVRHQAQRDEDTRAIDAMIMASVRGDSGAMALAFDNVRKRWIGRIAALDARDAKVEAER